MAVEPHNVDVLGPWNQLLIACNSGDGIDLDVCVLRTRISLGLEPHQGLYIEVGVTKAFVYVDGTAPNYVFRCQDQSTFPYPYVKILHALTRRQREPEVDKMNPFEPLAAAAAAAAAPPTVDQECMAWLLRYIIKSLEVRKMVQFKEADVG